MIWEKTLTIGGTAVPVVEFRVVLELGAAGMGQFSVEGSPEDIPSEAALFTVTDGGRAKAYPILSGIVTEAQKAGEGVTAITIREPAFVLDTPANFYLRHPTPRDVLGAINAATGLLFLVPEAMLYLDEKRPHFVAEGTHRQALDVIGAAFGIDQAVWTSLPDGRIWWGDWADGPFPGTDNDAVILDTGLITAHDPGAKAIELPLLPQARPGAVVEVPGNGVGPVMIQRAAFEGETVRLSWGEVG